MNKALLIGRLGQDVELSYLPNGTAKASFSVATSEKRTVNGEKKEYTEWHRLVAWAKTAEIIAQYFHKGDPIVVEGRITYRSWEDKDGNKRWMTEIVVNSFEFVPKTSGGRTEPGNDEDAPF